MIDYPNVIEGQMSLSDLGIWSGKTSLVPSVQTKEKTSELCWKKWQGSSKKESLFLDLRKGSGAMQESSSVTDGQLLGESSMLNIGESLNEGSGFALSQILMAIQQPKSYLTRLNNTDAPTEEIPSHLSEILEQNPDPKYNLSAKACQGILNRAQRRGKKLPPMLQEALEQVILLSHTKTEKDVQGGGKGFLLQEDRSASLRTNNFQTVFQPVETVALEGNGQRPSHMGDGYSVSDKSYTLNSTEVHGVAYAVDMGGGKSACDIIEDKSPTLCTTHYGEPAVVYDARGNGDGNIVPTMTGDHQNRITDYTGVVVSMDRETFNTGQNFAQTLGIRDDGIQPTLVARGPGAVCYWDGTQVAGTLTANNADGSQRMPDKDNFNCVVERINCGETYCTEGTKALQLLWSAYGEEKVFEWGTSILERIQSSEVLQQRMHEESIQEATTQRNILDDNILPCEELVAEWIMRDMWKREECGCTSQGLESTKQQHRESSEIMQELSQQNPQTCKELFDMWKKGEGIWILRQALSEIQKMGKSIHCEHRKIRYIVRRLTPLECTRLQGYPDGWVDIDTFVDSNGKTRKVSDSHKYKALGNSIALPSWRWVLKRMCANYERPATMASLFDGISGFPWLWTQINGRNSVLWTSEIEDFPSEVCKRHFGNEAKGEIGDYETFL